MQLPEVTLPTEGQKLKNQLPVEPEVTGIEIALGCLRELTSIISPLELVYWQVLISKESARAWEVAKTMRDREIKKQQPFENIVCVCV